MRRVRQLLVPVTAVGAGVVLSACGGDSSPETLITVPTQTTTGLTKTEFIAQADSACAEANAAIEQFAAAGQGVSEADQIAQLRQGVVDQVRELGPPAEDRATLDQFLTAMRGQVAAGQKIALATERGEDTAEFEAELDAAKSDAETAASAYGFQECGSQISSSGTSTAVAPDTGGTVTPTPTPAEPVTPAPAPDTGDSGGTAGGGVGGDTGGDTGGGTGDSGGVSPGGGISP
jgi:hypothetical protein